MKHYARVGVNANVCPKCIKAARHKFVNILILRLVIFFVHLAIMIYTAGPFYLFASSLSSYEYYMHPLDELTMLWAGLGALIFMPTAIITFVAAATVLDLVILQRNPAKRFMKISMKRGGVKYIFENDLYGTLFKSQNYDADIKIKKKEKAFTPEDLAKVETVENPPESYAQESSGYNPSYSAGFGSTTPEPKPLPVTKSCPKCGAILQYKAKFCNKCGHKFAADMAGNVEEL